jgi:hypothetical protein
MLTQIAPLVPSTDNVPGNMSVLHEPSPSPVSTTPLLPPAPLMQAQMSSQSPPSPISNPSATTASGTTNSVTIAAPRRLPSLEDLPPLPLRPLDYTLLLSSSEGLHSQLAGTVEELSQWLGAIEAGLGTVLAEADLLVDDVDDGNGEVKGGVVRIPEENEDTDSADDSLSDTAVETLAAH